jgi:hypothetical protein
MGLLDYGAKVLVELKGDSKDLERALKSASLEEKKLLQTQIEGIKKGNDALESKIATIGKVAAGVGAAIAVWKAADASFKAYAQRTKFESAAMGVSLDRLKIASGGLKSEMQLLEFAAKTNAGAFKLTEQQMGVALQAMRSLERKGYDTDEVFRKVTEAVTEAKTEALEPFGVQIEATGTKTEKVAAIMRKLAEEANGVGDSSLTAGERQKAMSVQFEDSIGKIKNSIGALVVALQPLVQVVANLISKVANLIDKMGITDLVNGIDDFDWEWGWQGPTAVSRAGKSGTDTSRRTFVPGKGWVARGSNLSNMSSWFAGPEEIDGGEMDFSKSRRRRRAAGGGGGERKSDAPPEWDQAGWESLWSDWSPNLPGPESITEGMGRGLEGIGMPGSRIIPEDTEVQMQRLAEIYQQFRTEQGQTFMQQAFGPIEEFDAYGTAFNTLSTTLSAGFDAWVSGSESFGKAMKAAFKQSLGAVASDMFAKSIQHAAYALGSLAFGDFRGAATHGAAAASFAAGALTIGSIARSISGPSAGGATAGVGGGASAGGAPSVLPAYNPGQSGNRQVTLVIGDDFAEDSPRKRAQKAGRYLQMGLRATAPNGVVYS